MFKNKLKCLKINLNAKIWNKLSFKFEKKLKCSKNLNVKKKLCLEIKKNLNGNIYFF